MCPGVKHCPPVVRLTDRIHNKDRTGERAACPAGDNKREETKMLYLYVLGCELACLVLMGASSMETVEVHPTRVAAQIVFWPAALLCWLKDRWKKR